MSTLRVLTVVMVIVTMIPVGLSFLYYRPKSSRRFFSSYRFVVPIAGLVCLWAAAIFPAFLLIPLVLAIVSIGCRDLDIAPKTARIWIATTAIALDLGFLSWWGNIFWGLKEQLRMHPVVSLANRLEYERDVRAITNFEPVYRAFGHYRNVDITKVPSANNVDLINTSRLEASLDDAAQQDETRGRGRRLESLLRAHRNIERQFVVSTIGNGISRSRELPYQTWRLDLPEAPVLPLERRQPNRSTTAPDNNVTMIGTEYQIMARTKPDQLCEPTDAGNGGMGLAVEAPQSIARCWISGTCVPFKSKAPFANKPFRKSVAI